MLYHTIDGIKLRLAKPEKLDSSWVGQENLRRQLLACWCIIDKGDIPLNPRLIGKPGVGKTTLAYAAAKDISKEIYIFQATMDTRPEDLIVTPVVGNGNTIQYVASSLVTAMIRGGVFILDEGNRMSEKAWASLAPLLDARRYVESIISGIKINAHPNFRFCTTMNDDSSTYDLPEYIQSRLQPQITVEFPERHEELLILRKNLPFVNDSILNYISGFLEQAHQSEENYTIRDGINIARFAAKTMKYDPTTTQKKAIRYAVNMVLGAEALMYAE